MIQSVSRVEKGRGGVFHPFRLHFDASRLMNAALSGIAKTSGSESGVNSRQRRRTSEMFFVNL